MFQLVKKHIKLAKWPLTNAIVDVENPLFIRHSNEDFLDRCKQGSTQNSNESFNSSMCSLFSKQQYNFPIEKLLSISLSVRIYNSCMQYTSLLKLTNMELGKNSQKQWQLINEEKLSIGIYKYREDIKLKRKLRKHSKIKNRMFSTMWRVYNTNKEHFSNP